jgi:hypothetical protein
LIRLPLRTIPAASTALSSRAVALNATIVERFAQRGKRVLNGRLTPRMTGAIGLFAQKKEP